MIFSKASNRYVRTQPSMNSYIGRTIIEITQNWKTNKDARKKQVILITLPILYIHKFTINKDKLSICCKLQLFGIYIPLARLYIYIYNYITYIHVLLSKFNDIWKLFQLGLCKKIFLSRKLFFTGCPKF